MLELIIIKNLLGITYYNKYRSFIRIKKDDRELYNMYSTLDEMMERYKRDISLDEYSVYILSKFPDYKEFISQIRDSKIGDDVLSDKVRELIDLANAHDLAILAIEVSEGRKSYTTLLDFYTKLSDKEEVEEINFVSDDLEYLYETAVRTKGLRWRLKTLNKMLGSLRKGDFGFIFARPETGKTTFLASEVTYMAGQLPDDAGPIIWFNNEEQGSKVQIRTYQASLGVELPKLFSNRELAKEEFMKRTKGKIKIFDDASINKRQVEYICRQLKPSLIIFDQIDKIQGFANDREDLRLGSIYIWARELAKTYCPVIGVTQADGSGDGVKWLTMSNVANAKTAKQAEADWILGIGASNDLGFEHVRYLHLSKNKLSGDEDSDPAMRHGKAEVIIKPEIARYADLSSP